MGGMNGRKKQMRQIHTETGVIKGDIEMSQKRANILITLLALLFLIVAMPAQADKLASDLEQAIRTADGEQQVIVTYAPTAGPEDIERINARSGRNLRKLQGRGGLNGRLAKQQILDLASDPGVLAISPDRVVHSTLDVGAQAIGADHIYENLGLTGAGVTVALVDSGLTPSDAVSASRILASVDFTRKGGNGNDRFGHGTHIAGIIGGSGEAGSPEGVARGVNFVSLRVLNEDGAGYVSDVIEAVE